MPVSEISNSRWKNKGRSLRLENIFLITLVGVSLLLCGFSFQYSRLLSLENNGATKVSEASNATSAAGSKSDTQRSIPRDVSVGSSSKYANDRVYCMVPFIWNKEIYDVSK